MLGPKSVKISCSPGSYQKICVPRVLHEKRVIRKQIHSHIQTLELSFAKFVRWTNEEYLKAISSLPRLSHLEKFTIDFGFPSDDLKCTTIQKIFLKLNLFKLSSLSELTLKMNECCVENGRKFAETLRRINPRLKKLHIQLFEEAQDVDIALMWKTCKRFTALNTLKLSIAKSIFLTNRSVRRLKSTLSSLTQLSSLTFTSSEPRLHITEKIGYAVKELRNLRSLVFYSVEEKPMNQALLLSGNMLRSLSLCHLYQRNLSVCEFQSTFCKKLRLFSNLQDLQLKFVAAAFLTLEGFAALTKSIEELKLLSFLDLNICHKSNIDERGLVHVLELLHNLVNLKIFHFRILHLFQPGIIEYQYDFEELSKFMQSMNSLKRACLETSRHHTIIQKTEDGIIMVDSEKYSVDD